MPLTHGLVTTDAVTRAFSDAALVGAMHRFEAALARAEAQVGVIPEAAADVISAVVREAVSPDVNALRADLRANATLSIAVVKALTARVAEVEAGAAQYVHWGATSQDLADTALVLCLREAWGSIERDHRRLATALDAFAVRHADTVMLGRTLLQPAVPTTFGLKAAGWLGGVARSWRAWSGAFERTQVLQFGGAAGTLASLGASGEAVERVLAAELGLEVPDAPWHAHRDRIASFVSLAGVYTGSLGKIAADVALLMQGEVAEAFEAGGTSSTMPHKRNPARCAAVLACAHRMPGLVAAMLAAMVHEHERGVGSWHVEGTTLVDAVQTAAAAVSSLAHAIESLSIDEDRMRANIDATRGVILAERLAMRLASHIGRDRATALVRTAVDESTRSGRSMAAVVADMPEVARLLDTTEAAGLFDPAQYLGSADAFRSRLRRGAAVTDSKGH